MKISVDSWAGFSGRASHLYLSRAKDAKPQRPDNEILGPDDVRRYTVNVYLVKNAILVPAKAETKLA